jgi:hypothetical protein
VIYSYWSPPEPAEPVVASAIIPPTPELVPEARYTYDTIAEGPVSTGPAGLVVPNLPVFEGWVGLRLPGRVIRYVSGS